MIDILAATGDIRERDQFYYAIACILAVIGLLLIIRAFRR